MRGGRRGGGWREGSRGFLALLVPRARRLDRGAPPKRGATPKRVKVANPGENQKAHWSGTASLDLRARNTPGFDFDSDSMRSKHEYLHTDMTRV